MTLLREPGITPYTFEVDPKLDITFYEQIEGGYVVATQPPTGLNQVIFEVYKQMNYIVDIGFGLRWTTPGVGVKGIQVVFPIHDEIPVPNIKLPTGDIVPVTKLPNTYDTIVSPAKTASIFVDGVRTRPKEARCWLLYESGVFKIHLESNDNLAYNMSGASSEIRYQQTILPIYIV
jgi:hypothetical protein